MFRMVFVFRTVKNGQLSIFKKSPAMSATQDFLICMNQVTHETFLESLIFKPYFISLTQWVHLMRFVRSKNSANSGLSDFF